MAVSGDWYVRQFGDRDAFAVTISLGRDPHPTGDTETDAAWGGLALWARGRCLTRNVSDDGGTCDEIRWTLGGIFEWLAAVGPRLVNGEPFPLAPGTDFIRGASDWFNSTETTYPTLTDQEETDWFLRRSDWRRHHAIRCAANDVALPNVILRRLGDFLEVSWDNETWGTARPGLRFVEQRGTEIVCAASAAAALREALCDATGVLAAKHDLSGLAQLAETATTSLAREDDWQWLVHDQTARLISQSIPSLADKFRSHAKKASKGWYIPHTRETLALRQTRLLSQQEIESFLAVAVHGPQGPMSDALKSVRKPSPAPVVRPWREGYEHAAEVREAFQWGDGPVPELAGWLRSQGVVVRDVSLAATIDLVVTRSKDLAASTTVNPRAHSRLRREIGQAAALGHLLLDTASVAVDGAAEHWPTASRARAFGVMLLLPVDGLRDILSGKASIDSDDVERVMQKFGTGLYATTFHLKNLGFIDDERRTEILHELAG